MIDFPDSPTLNQVFQGPNGVSYTWNGTLWLVQNTFAGGTGDFYATGAGGAMSTGTATVTIPTTINSGNASLSYNVANGRWTPPAGRYSLFCGLNATGAAGSAIYGFLYKNGTQLPNVALSDAVGATPGGVSIQAIVDANGSDYFEFRTQSAPGSITLGSFYFGAFPLTGMQGPMGPSGNMLINGAGAPTGLSAAKGTLYINTTATTTTTRLYINTDGGTTWANFTASA